MFTLGINAAFHDPAACLVKDGKVLAAAEEERFTRIKHGKRPLPFSTWELPFHAIAYCLREAEINLRDVDHVAYAFDPALLLAQRPPNQPLTLPLEPSASHTSTAPWEELFLSYIINAPRQLADGAPHHLAQYFKGVHYDGPFEWHFVNHHLAHAISAFYPSGWQDAAVLVVDGRGELASTSYYHGIEGECRLLGYVALPHSLGLFYEDITEYLGFLRSSDEYKVMALASYGKPRFVEQLNEIVSPVCDGQYSIAPTDLEERFGPRRERGTEIEPRHLDLACSLQALTEERLLSIVKWLRHRSGSDSLCMAGGVALNCVANALIRDSGLFSRIWIQPAAGDAGTALGAALQVDQEQRGSRQWHMSHAYLGPAFGEKEIEQALRWAKLPYTRPTDLVSRVAHVLSENSIVGWFQGRMEFGPRALGARSILASPITPQMQARLNDLKGREEFRPVAPLITEEEVEEWFVPGTRSPFMLFTYQIREKQIGRIPSAAHHDGSARVQTVSRTEQPLLHQLLSEFKAITGVPVLINTSFNIRSEPMVCTPSDAIQTFFDSPLEHLAIGPFLLSKTR